MVKKESTYGICGKFATRAIPARAYARPMRKATFSELNTLKWSTICLRPLLWLYVAKGDSSRFGLMIEAMMMLAMDGCAWCWSRASIIRKAAKENERSS